MKDFVLLDELTEKFASRLFTTEETDIKIDILNRYVSEGHLHYYNGYYCIKPEIAEMEIELQLHYEEKAKQKP